MASAGEHGLGHRLVPPDLCGCTVVNVSVPAGSGTAPKASAKEGKSCDTLATLRRVCESTWIQVGSLSTVASRGQCIRLSSGPWRPANPCRPLRSRTRSRGSCALVSRFSSLAGHSILDPTVPRRPGMVSGPALCPPIWRRLLGTRAQASFVPPASWKPEPSSSSGSPSPSCTARSLNLLLVDSQARSVHSFLGAARRPRASTHNSSIPATIACPQSAAARRALIGARAGGFICCGAAVISRRASLRSTRSRSDNLGGAAGTPRMPASAPRPPPTGFVRVGGSAASPSNAADWPSSEEGPSSVSSSSRPGCVRASGGVAAAGDVAATHSVCTISTTLSAAGSAVFLVPAPDDDGPVRSRAGLSDSRALTGVVDLPPSPDSEAAGVSSKPLTASNAVSAAEVHSIPAAACTLPRLARSTGPSCRGIAGAGASSSSSERRCLYLLSK